MKRAFNKATVNRGHIVIALDGKSNMYRTVTVVTEQGKIRTARTINFRIELSVKPTKYTLKCATGLFRIRRVSPTNDPLWRAWWGDWEICKRGTTIPRDTVRPLTTFSDIYRAYHTFDLI